MRKYVVMRLAVYLSFTFCASPANAVPLVILPYASQVTTLHYDARGRVVAVIRSGQGAPNGCAGSSPAWGSGTLGCFRWSS